MVKFIKKRAGKSAPLSPPEISEPGKISFGSVSMAAGLIFQPLEERSPAAVAKDITQSTTPGEQTGIGYDLYLSEKGSDAANFGSSDIGHKKGMKALITSIPRDISGETWIGAFRVGERAFWMGYVQDGKLFSDIVFREEAEARDHFMREYSYGTEWDAVFAPLEWSISEADTRPLNEICDPARGKPLKYVRPIKSNIGKISLGVFVLVAAGGAYVILDGINERRMAELEALREQMRSRVTLGPQDYPYRELTRIQTFVDVCRAEIQEAVILTPGWEAQPISCSIQQGSGEVTTGWTNSGSGRSSWLRASIPPDHPDPVFSDDGESASHNRDFQAPYDEDSFSDSPWGEEEIVSRLRERFQSYGMDISMRPSAGNRPYASQAPVFNSTDIRVTTSMGIDKLGDILSDVPALVPETMIYNVQTAQWDLALKAYHRVMMPSE